VTSATTGGATAPGQQTSADGAAGAVWTAGEPIPLATPSPASEACPLCATPLGPDQDWCLRCGAAARTRLAATPNWKAPILAIAVVAVLALGVLAAALVKLAGGSSAASPPVTTTITAATAPAMTAPAATTPSSAATTPGAAATTPNSATTTTPGVAGAQGAATVTTTPGAPGSTTVTTLTPAQREAQRQAASPLSTK
jgi:hypothetical protein